MRRIRRRWFELAHDTYTDKDFIDVPVQNTSGQTGSVKGERDREGGREGTSHIQAEIVLQYPNIPRHALHDPGTAAMSSFLLQPPALLSVSSSSIALIFLEGEWVRR